MDTIFTWFVPQGIQGALLFSAKNLRRIKPLLLDGGQLFYSHFKLLYNIIATVATLLPIKLAT